MTRDRRSVVITGGTRGIGKGMAREFLKRGHCVTICGRTEDAVTAAVGDLTGEAEAGGGRIIGAACDVSDYGQVKALWDRAVEAFGTVDIWINNAGMTNRSRPFAALPVEDILKVPAVNLLGLMNGCKVALEGMQAQGHGAIYNFEGFGSNGMHNRTSHVYGATKFAVRSFTRALVEETKGGPVLVGYMSPGMVVTDLLVGEREKLPPQAWNAMKKIFNILADHVETVTPFLVEGALKNKRHGGRIYWLTRRKSAWRLLTARFTKRDLFGEEGARSAA